MLEEVVNEVLNIIVRDVITLELIQEFLEILLGDVAKSFLVDQLKNVRFLLFQVFHSFNDIEYHGLFQRSALETLSLKHKIEFLILNKPIFVLVHLFNKQLNVFI